MITENGKVRILAGRYPLLPQGLYEYCQEKWYLVSNSADTRTKKDLLKTGLLPEDAWVVFGDVICYRGVDVTQTADRSVRFDFILECVAEMEHDFTLWMHIFPDDINLLEDGIRTRGYVSDDHSPEMPTSTWKVGNIYTHTRFIYQKETGIPNSVFGCRQRKGMHWFGCIQTTKRTARILDG